MVTDIKIVFSRHAVISGNVDGKEISTHVYPSAENGEWIQSGTETVMKELEDGSLAVAGCLLENLPRLRSERQAEIDDSPDDMQPAEEMLAIGRNIMTKRDALMKNPFLIDLTT